MLPLDLPLTPPLAVPLAADQRLSRAEYPNDIVWELSAAGQPPALSLHTTFGLRTHWMRLFPRFVTPAAAVQDPQSFAAPPRLTFLSPAFVRLAFTPLPSVETVLEIRVPTSQVLAGRFTFKNPSVLPQRFTLEWCHLLSPLPGGQSMAFLPLQLSPVLQGRSANLAPVGFLAGGAAASQGPYPGLSLSVDLPPGVERSFTWALAALADPQASFEAARAAADSPWEAETARAELLHAAQTVSIRTGSPDWDAALALSQHIAPALFFPASPHLPHPSAVLSRRPDQGHSLRGDGSDYDHQWNGQPSLDSAYLAALLGPGGVDLARGLLLNFLAVQQEDGFIDWKPGLAGQRSRHLAQPLFSVLALELHRQQPDLPWLMPLYPQLRRFFLRWFAPDRDRDQDGWPEWDHPLQTGLEDSPLYDRWNPHAQGVPPARLECPSLAAMLYREGQSLGQIAALLGHAEDREALQPRLNTLRQAVESTWDAKAHTYRYRDVLTHTTRPVRLLFTFQGSGLHRLRKSFKQPTRLHLHLYTPQEITQPVLLTLEGEDEDGPITEQISAVQFTWNQGHARWTSEKAYKKLHTLGVKNISPQTTGRLEAPDTSQDDLSLLLPLWAGIPSPRRARELVESTLIPRYLQPFGLALAPPDRCPPAPSRACGVSPLWNALIVDGLLQYGYYDLAAEILTRLMNGISAALRAGGTFREIYPAAPGQPCLGEMNPLRGLPPVHLFLRLAGIHQFVQNGVIVHGFNRFFTPVTVKYHQTLISCQSRETVVRIAAGESITIQDPGSHRVQLDAEPQSPNLEERRNLS